MKKKVLILLMALMVAMLTVGCGEPANNDDPQKPDGDTQTAGVIIKQYFASSKYVYDGQDEENGELMPPVEFTLPEDADNIYMAAINSLINLPSENADTYYTMMEEKFVCNNVSVEDGVAYVDFASKDLTGGSLTEMVLVDQIVYTLANSFEEIAAVKFTLDGQATETLMGHIDTSEPFVADYL